MNFPGGSICSSNRHEFSRRVYMFFEQTRIFQEGLSKRHVFLRRFYLFVKQTLLSHRTDTNFSRNPYLVLEHIQIFPGASIFSSNRYSFSRKLYLVLEHIRLSRRSYLALEHIRFSRRPLCLEQILIFQEGIPSRTDISLIGLGGCFRNFKLQYYNSDNYSFVYTYITFLRKLQQRLSTQHKFKEHYSTMKIKVIINFLFQKKVFI